MPPSDSTALPNRVVSAHTDAGYVLIAIPNANRAATWRQVAMETGHPVVVVRDGEEAQQQISTRGVPILLVTDLSLPKLDGFSVVRALRQQPATRRVPVLLLTARREETDKVLGLELGADDYLCKPFAFEELLARVRALLRRPEQSTSLALDYVDIHADLGSQRATRDGSPLDLTAKEFSLLCLFLRHPGKVLSRTRIFDAVWHEQYDGLSNTLEVHVKELRRKLEAFGPRVIQTRRGRGYVLDASESDEA